MPNTPPSSPQTTKKSEVSPSTPQVTFYAGGLFGKTTIPKDAENIRHHDNHLHITRPCGDHAHNWLVYDNDTILSEDQVQAKIQEKLEEKLEQLMKMASLLSLLQGTNISFLSTVANKFASTGAPKNEEFSKEPENNQSHKM